MNAILKKNFSATRQQIVRNRARFLQLALWNRRSELWAQDVPETPIDVLQPAVALKLNGFNIESRYSLGEEWDRGLRAEVAAMIDRGEQKVYVSSRYPFVVQNFTIAHELGHVVLHPHIDVKHRELPKDGPGRQNDWEEREADWFATEFLMPEKQVRLEFQRRFGSMPFRLTDDSAYALCNASVDRVMRQWRCARDFSKCLADAAAFGEHEFLSLAKQFSVSSKAMAIRIDELQLVDF
jgi:hypothetical protein